MKIKDEELQQRLIMASPSSSDFNTRSIKRPSMGLASQVVIVVSGSGSLEEVPFSTIDNSSESESDDNENNKSIPETAPSSPRYIWKESKSLSSSSSNSFYADKDRENENRANSLDIAINGDDVGLASPSVSKQSLSSPCQRRTRWHDYIAKHRQKNVSSDSQASRNSSFSERSVTTNLGSRKMDYLQVPSLSRQSEIDYFPLSGGSSTASSYVSLDTSSRRLPSTSSIAGSASVHSSPRISRPLKSSISSASLLPRSAGWPSLMSLRSKSQDTGSMTGRMSRRKSKSTENFSHLERSAILRKEALMASSAPVSPIQSRTDTPRRRKKSLLERLGESMISEKGLFAGGKKLVLGRSASNPTSGSSILHELTGAIGEISFPKGKKSKTRQRYRIVEAKTRQPDGISFEVVGKSGFYLRAKGTILVAERDGADSYFNKDSTFVPLPDMWFQNYFAFESVSKPSFFIRLTQQEELVLDKYDGTQNFKEEASFMMRKKPCATCLQVGVKGWARLPNGEYCLGKVTKINGMIEVTLEDGKRIEYPANGDNFLVPDVIPSHRDLPLGKRVLAQWLSRESLYPGIITGVHGNEYDVQFDDGDLGKEKAYQIRIIRTHLKRGEHSHESGSLPSTPDPLLGKQTEIPIKIENVENTQTQKKKESYSGQKQGSLWSYEEPESPLEKQREEYAEESLPSTSTSSSADQQHENEVLEENDTLRNLTNIPNLKTCLPFEMETISNDSGYHGYNKQFDNKDLHFFRRKMSVPVGKSSSVRLYSFDLKGNYGCRTELNQKLEKPLLKQKTSMETPM